MKLKEQEEWERGDNPSVQEVKDEICEELYDDSMMLETLRLVDEIRREENDPDLTAEWDEFRYPGYDTWGDYYDDYEPWDEYSEGALAELVLGN